MIYTQEQKDKLLRLVKTAEGGELALLQEINALHERLDTLSRVLNDGLQYTVKLSEATHKMKGDAGYTPVKGIDYADGEPGSPGKDYIPTESDLNLIAEKAAKKIKVPVIEKVIEIVKEQPIVTNQIVKEIVDSYDPSAIEQEIADLKNKIDVLMKRVSNSNGSVFGRVGIQILSSGSKIGIKTNEINFGTGLTTTQVNGRVTVTASSAGLNVETPTGTVNGSNTTFTVSNTPKAVVIDGLWKFSGQGYTYAAGTITADPLNPPTNFIKSIY